ncbi:hypothetical protein ElyMa_002556900 [Elysia marginata]|uniref:SpoVT-AbrB domain-containing protein n=1 Tax=Elysia marginata TaxID=1093978 RepID=A0AAV4GXJ9_9GAST|nr:hypothetical protein ElyMa_002556900 [Elysia marginata]
MFPRTKRYISSCTKTPHSGVKVTIPKCLAKTLEIKPNHELRLYRVANEVKALFEQKFLSVVAVVVVAATIAAAAVVAVIVVVAAAVVVIVAATAAAVVAVAAAAAVVGDLKNGRRR